MKKFIQFFYLILFFLVGIHTISASDLTIMPISSNSWGDATLLESGGEYLLIDVTYGNTSDVLDFLDYNNVTKLDLYLSHYHGDHFGSDNELKIDDEKINLIEYMIRSGKYEIGTLYLPDDTICKNTTYSESVACERFIERWKTAKTPAGNTINVEILTTGSKFEFGNTTAEVLFVNKDENIVDEVSALMNNSSLVTMFTNGKTKFLTAGDIEQPIENKILEEGIDISADIFKLSHHALQYENEISNTEKFINAVKPKYSYFQFNMTTYKSVYSHIQQSIENLSNFSNIYTPDINGNIKFIIKDDVITPFVMKNGKTITIQYIDEESKKILDTKEYWFAPDLYGNTMEYHLYDYVKQFDGYIINQETSTIETTGVLEEDVVYNINYKKAELWDKFVQKFKNTELVSLYDDSEIQLEITSTENSLSVVLINEGQTFTTNFAYENGILKYKSESKEDDAIFADSIWQMNAIYALSELKGYDIDKVSIWLEENKGLILEDDGIEYVSKDYNYKKEEDGVNITIEATILTSLELDIKNGFKSYNEDIIPVYKFIEGENQKYKFDEKKELIFKINGEYEKFENVYINGKLLDKENYTVIEGSTIITLKKEYLNTLKNGVHTIKVTYKDGEFAQSEFTIDKTVENPTTGIGITYGILVLAIGLVGIYLLIRKQSKFPKHN